VRNAKGYRANKIDLHAFVVSAHNPKGFSSTKVGLRIKEIGEQDQL